MTHILSPRTSANTDCHFKIPTPAAKHERSALQLSRKTPLICMKGILLVLTLRPTRNRPRNIFGLFPKIKLPAEHDLPLVTIQDDHSDRHVAGDDVGVGFFIEGRPHVCVAAMLELLE